MMTSAYATGATLGIASCSTGIAVSFVFGVWLFDEKITAMAMAGMVLIVAAGVAATLLRGSKLRRADAAPTET